MFVRAHFQATLLVAALAIAGCSDYVVQSDGFTAPSKGSRSLRLSQDSVMLPVGKAVVLGATLISSSRPVGGSSSHWGNTFVDVSQPAPGSALGGNTFVNATPPAASASSQGSNATVASTQPTSVISWRTSDSTVAVVNGSGKVTAVAPGTATVTATVADSSQAGAAPVSATSTVTVPASPANSTPAGSGPAGSGPAGSGVTPELPRVTVDVSMPTGTGHSIQLNAQGDLQAAINAASPGDQIILQAGATFTGNYSLPVKNGTGWVIIRSSGTLPGVGNRVHPSDASQMAKIVAADPSYPVVYAMAGAHNYRLIGLEVTAPAGATHAYSLVNLGDGSRAQNTVASMAHDLVLDRVYVHGTPTLNFQRCIALNSGSAAIVDSYISECHGKGFDSQAIAGWNGSGPYRIENNYLEGAGENVMFGGADPQIANMLPRDIVVRHNYFYKPAAWKGVWEVKNLVEFKLGQRILVDGNVFENNWTDAQDGTAILFKSVNQGGSAPWSQTSDVTFQNNIVKNVAQAVSLASNPERKPAVPAARIALNNNVFYKVGDGDYPGGRIFLMAGIQGLTIQHNTAFGHNYGIQLLGSKISQLIMQDNIFGSGGDLVKGDAVGSGINALTTYATTWVFRRNIIVGAYARLNPPDNFFPATEGDLGLSATFALPAGSPYLTSATDGTAIGANISAINAATSNVTH